MTLREELILKCCLNSSEFGNGSMNVKLEIRHSNRVYDYLKKRLPACIFDNLEAKQYGNRMYIVAPNNIN